MTMNVTQGFTPYTQGTQQQLTLQLGKFLLSGDAQSQLYGMGAQTTDATATSLLTDTLIATSKIPLRNNQTLHFEARIVARSIGGQSAGYLLQGVIDRGANAASTALVGSVTKTVLAEDDAAWDVSAVADTTNGALDIQVTGVAATNINWVAQVRTFEVIHT